MLNEQEEKGAYGPYKQSLRKEIYQAYAKYFIEIIWHILALQQKKNWKR